MTKEKREHLIKMIMTSTDDGKIIEDIANIIACNLTMIFTEKTFQKYKEIGDDKKKYIMYHLTEDENFSDQAVDSLIFYLEKKSITI